MEVTNLNTPDPRDQMVIQEILNREPKSKIIFQQSFSPSGLQKGLSYAPLLLILVGAVPILIFLFFTFFIFSSVPRNLAPNGFSAFMALFFAVPIFMLAMVFALAYFGRKVMKKTIGMSYTYAVIETPTDFIQVSIKNGMLDGFQNRFPKNSIRRFYYQESPIRRLSSSTQFNNSWTADIYSQILVEYEDGTGMPKVDLLAQSPKYQAGSIYSLKSYLEQEGFHFGSQEPEIICPSCNSKSPRNATYCENCGFNLSKTSALI